MYRSKFHIIFLPKKISDWASIFQKKPDLRCTRNPWIDIDYYIIDVLIFFIICAAYKSESLFSLVDTKFRSGSSSQDFKNQIMLQQFKVLTCFIACFALVFVTFKKVTPLILFETNSLTNRKQKCYKNPISPRPNQGVDKVSLTNKHFLLTYELSFSAQQLALFSIVKTRISEK